jgi:hypothetical protein
MNVFVRCFCALFLIVARFRLCQKVTKFVYGNGVQSAVKEQNRYELNAEKSCIAIVRHQSIVAFYKPTEQKYSMYVCVIEK